MNWTAIFILCILLYVSHTEDPYAMAFGGILFIGLPLWSIAKEMKESHL